MQSDMHDPKTVGPYRILAEIAQGRLASIHLAMDSSEREASSPVVVKRVLPELTQVPGWGELLSDEALLLSSIRHPNVVTCRGSGRDDGGYVVLDYVEGDSLAGLLSRSAAWRQPRLLLPVIADALRGLAAAHAAVGPDGESLRVVHQAPHARHILVGTDGRARLADFTQARVQSLAMGNCRTERLRGGILSPEQTLEPQRVDARTDLFVLGATLWEGLTGESLLAVSSWVVHSATNTQVRKPSAFGTALPADFDGLCLRALERDSERRFLSAEEMLEELLRAARRAGAATAPSEIGQWVRTTCATHLGTLAARGSVREEYQASPVAVIESNGPRGKPQEADAEPLALPDAKPSPVNAPRATMIGMPPITLTPDSATIPPQAALALQPAPSVTIQPPTLATFSATGNRSAEIPGRLETTLRGGPGALRAQPAPITGEPPAYRREVASPEEIAAAPEYPTQAGGLTLPLEQGRQWSSVHDTRWAEFAARSRHHDVALAERESAAGGAAALAQVDRPLSARVALCVGTVGLLAVVLFVGDLAMRSVQRWPGDSPLDVADPSAGSSGSPRGTAVEGESERAAPSGSAFGNGLQFVPPAVESASRPNAAHDADKSSLPASSVRGSAISTPAPARVAPVRVPPRRGAPAPRRAPRSLAPTAPAAPPLRDGPARAAPPPSVAPANVAPGSVTP